MIASPQFYTTTPTIRSKHQCDDATSSHHNNNYQETAQQPPPPQQPVPDYSDTNGHVYESDERNLREYKDRIKYINLNRKLRRLCIPVPSGYWTKLWCVDDGCGIAGSVFTWILIVFGETVFFFFVILPFHHSTWSALNGAFSLTCAFLGFVSHLRAMFTDPVSSLICDIVKCFLVLL